MADRPHVAQNPPTGHTGLIDQPGGGDMSTRTHDTATAPATGPGGRGRGPFIAIIVAVALVVIGGGIYLATRNNTTPPPATPTTSLDPATAARDAALAASVAQVKTLWKWYEVHPEPAATPPASLATAKFIAQSKTDAQFLKGYRVQGLDTVVWTMPGNYSATKQTTEVTQCLEAHAKVLDATGKNVRTDPNGKAITDGQHIGIEYTLASTDHGKTWLIDSSKTTPTC